MNKDIRERKIAKLLHQDSNLSAKQIATLLGRSDRTVYRWQASDGWNEDAASLDTAQQDATLSLVSLLRYLRQLATASDFSAEWIGLAGACKKMADVTRLLGEDAPFTSFRAMIEGVSFAADWIDGRDDVPEAEKVIVKRHLGVIYLELLNKFEAAEK